MKSIASWLAEVALARRSCELWCFADWGGQEVTVREGLPVYATPRAGVDDIVTWLVQTGAVAADRATDLLSRVPVDPSEWEQDLSLFDETVSRGEMYAALEAAVRQRLLNLFGTAWVDIVERQTSERVARIPMFRIEPARLVVDGVVGYLPESLLAEGWPLDVNARIDVRLDRMSLFPGFALDANEAEVVQRLDGRTFSEAVALGLGEPTALRRFVCALATLGVLSVRSGAETRTGVEPVQPVGEEWAVLETPPAEPQATREESEEIAVVYDPNASSAAGFGEDMFAVPPEPVAAPVEDEVSGDAVGSSQPEPVVGVTSSAPSIPATSHPRTGKPTLVPRLVPPPKLTPTALPWTPLRPAPSVAAPSVAAPSAIDAAREAPPDATIVSQAPVDPKRRDRTQSGERTAVGLAPKPSATPAVQEKPASQQKDLPPLARRFPQYANKDYFALLGVGHDFQPFEMKNAFSNFVRVNNFNRFEQVYRGADIELALSLLEHACTAQVVLTDGRLRGKYLDQLAAKGGDTLQIDDARNKAAIQALVGETLMRHKAYAHAEVFLTRATEADQKAHEYQLLLAKNLYLWAVEIGQEVPAKVKGLLENVIALDHTNYEAYLYLGYYYKHTERPDLAIRRFRDAVEANPKGHEAASELRLLTMRQQQEKKKGSFLGISLRRKPEKKGKEE